MMTTIVLPAFSSRAAWRKAAVRAAPELMPTVSPSVRAARRAMSKASSLLTCSTESITSRSTMEGTKPAPIPWILCGPGSPPDRTGESVGSTATICTDGFFAFSTWPTPVIVPPVPTPAITMSTAPSVSAQISSAVETRWMAGLAGLSNWAGETAPGVFSSSSCAVAMAPFIPLSAGVSTSSAPSSASILRRSIDMLSGMTRIRR